MAGEYVFTVRCMYADGGIAIWEMFRGTEAECRDMAAKFGGAALDERERRCLAAQPIVGPLADWTDFLEET